MSKVTGLSDATNCPSWTELRRYVAQAINLIVAQVNGRLSFQDNLATAGPYTLTFSAGQLCTQNHNLSQVPQGLVIVKKNQAMDIYAPDANPWTAQTVYLKSTAAGTITFYLL